MIIHVKAAVGLRKAQVTVTSHQCCQHREAEASPSLQTMAGKSIEGDWEYISDKVSNNKILMEKITYRFLPRLK